jgi:tetratricopeptide (TPR) repeat protein
MEGLPRCRRVVLQRTGPDKIRADLRQRLAASPTTRALPVEAFIDRLVVEVLEASSRPEIRDRLLTRDDLSRLAEEARRELGEWERFPAAERIRRVFDELDQIGRLLYDNAAVLPLNPSPGKLLTASYEVVPFEEAGRQGEIEALKDWCDGEDARSVLLLTGEGGSGKTRLAIEWCRRLRHQGWHAGFLRRDRNEALHASREAVQLYRRLVAHRPDAYHPGLAMALTNVANSLDSLERQKESVAPSRETVDIYRQLAIRRPAAFNPDLARSLNNLAVILEALGQDQEALPIARESVDIYRLLAVEYPDSFLPYLAMSLNTMSNCLRNAGERFLAVQEAIQICLPFFQLRPRVLKSEMELLTRNYSKAAEAAGESPDRELLRSIEEASEPGKRSNDR